MGQRPRLEELLSLVYASKFSPNNYWYLCIRSGERYSSEHVQASVPALALRTELALHRQVSRHTLPLAAGHLQLADRAGFACRIAGVVVATGHGGRGCTRGGGRAPAPGSRALSGGDGCGGNCGNSSVETQE